MLLLGGGCGESFSQGIAMRKDLELGGTVFIGRQHIAGICPGSTYEMYQPRKRDTTEQKALPGHMLEGDMGAVQV